MAACPDAEETSRSSPVNAKVWFRPHAADTITSWLRPSMSLGASTLLVSPCPSCPFSLRPADQEQDKVGRREGGRAGKQRPGKGRRHTWVPLKAPSTSNSRGGGGERPVPCPQPTSRAPGEAPGDQGKVHSIVPKDGSAGRGHRLHRDSSWNPAGGTTRGSTPKGEGDAARSALGVLHEQESTGQVPALTPPVRREFPRSPPEMDFKRGTIFDTCPTVSSPQCPACLPWTTWFVSTCHFFPFTCPGNDAHRAEPSPPPAD